MSPKMSDHRSLRWLLDLAAVLLVVLGRSQSAARDETSWTQERADGNMCSPHLQRF